MKRLICLLLCLCSICALCACGSKIGSSQVNTQTVLTIGDFKVTMDEYLYICYKYREAFDNGDRSYWDAHPEKEAEFLEDVLQELCAVYAIRDLAKEYGVELSAEDEDLLDSIILSYVMQYQKDEKEDLSVTEQAYLDAAHAAHMTGDLVRSEVELELLQETLFAYMIEEQRNLIASDDATVESKIAQGEYYCVKYIMLQHLLTDADSLAANRAVAQDLQEKAAQGMDFDELCSLAREQSSGNTYSLLFHSEGGSYFIKDYLDASTEAAILALADYGVSDVIESENFLCIYQRVPCDSEYMNGRGFSDMRDLYLQQQFSRICAERAQQLRQKIKFKSPYEGAFSVRTSA